MPMSGAHEPHTAEAAHATTRGAGTAPTRTATGRTCVSSPWLRRFLALDAVVTVANGLAYLAFSGQLGRFFGAGQGVVLGIGAFLTCYALAVGALAARARTPVQPVRLVIEINAAWAVLSLVAVAFLFSGLTTEGLVWALLQAVAVAAFALVQHLALRSARS